MRFNYFYYFLCYLYLQFFALFHRINAQSDLCAEDPTQPCLSCPHGYEACYKCTADYALINYNCQPINSLSPYNYYILQDSDKNFTENSEICPEETHYIDSTGEGASLCIECPSECDGCYLSQSTGSAKCWDCANGYNMQNPLSASEESRYVDSNWNPLCIQKPVNTSSKEITLSITISPTAIASTSGSSSLTSTECSQGVTLTFDSFFKALIFVEEICSPIHSEGDLSFYFADGTHFVMIDDPKYLSNDISIFEFFRNSNFRILIRSATSKTQTKVYWRTEQIRIYSFNSLTLSDLTIDGSENKAYLNTGLNKFCFTQRNLCCDTNSPNYSAQYKCDDTSAVKPFRVTSLEPDLVGQGLFTMLSSKRYSKDALPSIVISRVDMINMMMDSPTRIRNFLKIGANYAFVSIDNFIVDKYYFPGGLVSNFRFGQAKRGQGPLINDLDIGLQRRSDCRMVIGQLPKESHCISIFISSSTFSNYNFLKYKRTFVSPWSTDSRYVESFTLNLFSSLTSVSISSSRFSRAMVAATLDKSNNSSGNDAFNSSNVMQCANSYSENSASDLLKSSYTKTDPNTHFDADIISQSTQLLGSHIVWQFFKGELSISDSTFDSNISYQSPALSLRAFSNYMGAAVLNENLFVNPDSGEIAFVSNAYMNFARNSFSNNFAFVANSVLSIYNHNHKFYAPLQIGCQNIQFDSNHFLNNLGCPTAYFTVSINCRFKDLTDNNASAKDIAKWTKFIDYEPQGTRNGQPINQVTFTNNEFAANYAIIANALFINGVKNLLVQANTFSTNGVLIAAMKSEIQSNNSPYRSLDGYDERSYPYFDENWMTESTALFVQHGVDITINKNVFDGNWAISSGDSYYGQSILLHRIIAKKDISISGNMFKSHVGIPMKQAKIVRAEMATLPIVGVHFIVDADLRKTIPNAIQIDMNENTFQNNTYKIDMHKNDSNNLKLNSYTLYSSGGSVSLIKFFTDNEIKGSQPVSTDYLYMVNAYIGVQIRNTILKFNSHLNGGCMIEISGMNVVQAQSNSFLSNDNDESGGSMTAGGKFCMLDSSPLTLSDRPVFKLLSQSVKSDTGVFFYANAKDAKYQIGDLSFGNAFSTNSIIIAINSREVDMEGNRFLNSLAMSGLIRMENVGYLNLKDLNIQASQPYTLSLASVKAFSLTGLLFHENDLGLFPEYVKAHIPGVANAYQKYLNSHRSTGIYIYRSRGTMRDSTFTSNIVANATVAYLEDNSLLSASGLLVSNNTALSTGGAFYATDESVLTISSSTFKSNSAVESSGCFFIQNSYLGIHDSSIINCSSEQQAGVARIEQSDVNVSSTMFSNNTARKEASIFYAIRSNLAFSHSEFSFNSANACAFISSYSTLSIATSKFNGNTANVKSKNIYATQSELMIANSTFIDRSEANQVTGAFIQIFKSTAKIQTSTFSSGKAEYGGAIMVEAFAEVSIDDCLFSDNRAISSGGAIASSSFLRITNSNFTRNSASFNGNDVYFKGAESLLLKQIQIDVSLGISIFVWANRFVASRLTVAANPSLVLSHNDQAKGIYAFQTREVQISESRFENLTAITGAGLHIKNQINAEQLVSQVSGCSFVSNSARYGAAIAIEGMSETRVLDTNFTKNYAFYFNDTIGTGNGAGIHYDCSLEFESKCNLDILRGRFVQNSAEMDGGGIKFVASKITIDTSTIFENNYAIYGKDIASYPIHLFRADSLLQEKVSEFEDPEAFAQGFSRLVSKSYIFKDQVSGQKTGLIYALADHYGNIVKTANSSFARFTTDQQSVYLLGAERVSVNGFFDFTKFVITLEPGSFLPLKLSTNAIPEAWLRKARHSLEIHENFRLLQAQQPNSKGTMHVGMSFRRCQLGEIQSGSECIKCPDYKFINQVEVEEGSGECKDCMGNAVCEGENEVAPLAGYWRLSAISENVVECPNQSACLGGVADDGATILSYQGNCSEGYEGILCMRCSEGYARSGESECVECVDNFVYDVRAAGTMLFTIYLLVQAVKGQLEEDGSEQQDTTVALMKVFANFSQTISIVSSFSIEWPSAVSTSTSVNTNVFSAPFQVFSIDCYLRGYGTSSTMVRIFLTIVTPILIMLGSVFFYCLYFVAKFGFKLITAPENQTKLVNTIVVTQLVIIFLFHPEIVDASFSLFQCEDLGDANSEELYLSIDPELKCYEGEHLRWVKYLGLPSILLWVFIVPLVMISILWTRRETIDKQETMATFGFLTTGYRVEYYYWEVIIMFRKSVLVVASVFLNTDPFTSGLNVMVYLLFWWFMQLKCKPFLTHELNVVEQRALLTSAFYVYFSLFFVVNDSNSFMGIFIMILLLIEYAGFHLFFGMVYAKHRLLEITASISGMAEEVKHPHLAKVFSRLANMKILVFMRPWLLEQQNIIEVAITQQEREQEVKFMQEIKHHHSQKSTHEEIKAAIKEAQQDNSSCVDVFLSLKQKNKELVALASGVASILGKKQQIDVNQRLKDIAQSIRGKKLVDNQEKGMLVKKKNSIPNGSVRASINNGSSGSKRNSKVEEAKKLEEKGSLLKKSTLKKKEAEKQNETLFDTEEADPLFDEMNEDENSKEQEESDFHHSSR